MRKKQPKKLLTYAMTDEVFTCIQEIMKEEEFTTMHKAINSCILDRKRLIEALRKEESDSNKLFHEKMDMEDLIYTLIKCLRKMDLKIGGKNTKTS